jgi:hypothetical protein
MNLPAPRVRALVGLLAFCLGVFVLAGCYTTLRHPVSADFPDDYDYSYHEKSCYDCHDEAAFYHAQYGVYFDYYYDSPWFGYYSDPWWYDGYWGRGYDEPRGSRDFGDSNDRSHWRRGVPSGAPRGGSGAGSNAPYLRDDYKPAPSKPSDPSKKTTKPNKQKDNKDTRSKGRRGKGK